MQAELPTQQNRNISLEVAVLIFGLEHSQGKESHCVYGLPSFIVSLKSQTKGLLARWYLQLAPYLLNLNLQYKVCG